MPHRFALTLLLLGAPLQAALASPADSSGLESTKLIALPFVLGNSDQGAIFGVGLGLSHPPRTYVLFGGQLTSAGRWSLDLEGELTPGSWRHVGKFGFSRSQLELYPRSGTDPEPIARANVENSELKLSALHRWGHLEIGPSVWIEQAKGMAPRDLNDQPLPIRNFPRLAAGTVALGGLRTRWRSARPVRPMDGIILDGIVQTGLATRDGWSAPRFDIALQGAAALARPLNNSLRLYLRSDARFQLEAPASVRNYLGGDKKLRGQPYRREVGRRVLMGRAQLHVTLTRHFLLPFQVLHALWSRVPAWRMEIEAVPFYDVGVVGDPDFGWLPVRHGLGGGLHFVLPPELVLRFDVAISPGADSPRYYIGIGESF